MNLRTLFAACGSFALVAAGCTSGNPNRPGDSRWQPQEPVAQSEADAAEADAAEADAAEADAAEADAAEAQEPEASEVAAPEEPASSASDAADPAAAASFGLEEVGAIPIIARVADDTIDVGELLDAWMQVNSREVSDILERLVSAKLVEIEARRAGITLTPQQIEAGYEETIAELETELQTTNPGMKLDDWIVGALGMEPAHYRAGLRVDVMRQLLAPRVVRTFMMAHERRNVRVLVTETRAEIEDALAEYRAGRDFGELVLERSIDPNKDSGGGIPPVLRSQSALSRLVFLTDVGEIGGPIQDSEEGRWMILYVDSEEPVVDGPWSEVRGQVEASLEEQGIVDPEYWQWKAEMGRRHEVDLEPLFELMQGSSKP